MILVHDNKMNIFNEEQILNSENIIHIYADI